MGCQWLAREESGGERTKIRCFSRSRNMVVFLFELFVCRAICFNSRLGPVGWGVRYVCGESVREEARHVLGGRIYSPG